MVRCLGCFLVLENLLLLVIVCIVHCLMYFTQLFYSKQGKSRSMHCVEDNCPKNVYDTYFGKYKLQTTRETEKSELPDIAPV